MNGIALLLNLDMAAMVVLALALIAVVTIEEVGQVVSMEVVAYGLLGASALALVLVSLLKFMRVEG